MKLDLEIRNSGGLHARPAAFLAWVVSKHAGQVKSVAKEGDESESFAIAESQSLLLRLLLLAAPQGAHLSFEVVGPDTEALTREIREALERDFFSIDCKASIEDCVKHYGMRDHREIADMLLVRNASDLEWWAKLGHPGSLPSIIAATLESELKKRGEEQGITFTPMALGEFRDIILSHLYSDRACQYE